MPGRPLTSLDLNNRAAAAVEQVWSALEEVNKLYKLLADTNITGNADAKLISAGLSPAEVTAIRNAITDLGSPNGLWGVAHAQKTVTSVNDFFYNAKLLTGVNYTG